MTMLLASSNAVMWLCSPREHHMILECSVCGSEHCGKMQVGEKSSPGANNGLFRLYLKNHFYSLFLEFWNYDEESEIFLSQIPNNHTLDSKNFLIIKIGKIILK